MTSLGTRTLLAVWTTFAAAWTVLRWQPLADPVGVVGVPLLTGYAERDEQLASYLFLILPCVLAWAMRRANGWPTPLTDAAAWTLVACTPAVMLHRGVAVPLLVLAFADRLLRSAATPADGTDGRLAGAAGPSAADRASPGLPSEDAPRPDPATTVPRPCFTAGRAATVAEPPLRWPLGLVLAWTGFPHLVTMLGGFWPCAALAAVAVAATAAAVRSRSTLWLLPLAAAPASASAPTDLLCGFAAALVVGGRATRPAGWCVLAGVVYLTLATRLPLADVGVSTASSVVGGIGIGLLLNGWPTGSCLKTAQHAKAAQAAMVRCAAAIVGRCPGGKGRADRLRTGRCGPFRADGTAVVGLLAVGVVRERWWCGMVLGLAALICGGRRRPALRTILTVLCLTLAFVPNPPRRTLDAFHDGQILSAVWEWSQGERLYAEVFPLRPVEFWSAVASRRLLEDSPRGYLLGQTLPAALAAPACFLLVLLWTGCGRWSLAAALTLAACPGVDGRTAVGLAVLLATLASLSVEGAAGCVGLVLTGTCAAFAGYDLFVPCVAAQTSALLTRRRKGACRGERWPARDGAGSQPGEPGKCPSRITAGPAERARPACSPGCQRPSDCCDETSAGNSDFSGTQASALLVRRVAVGMAFACLLAAVVSVALGLAFGPSVPRWFWQLLWEYARNYSAWYGLPLPSDEFGLGLWTAATAVAAWVTVEILVPSRGWRRAGAVALPVFATLWCQRAVGRSDAAHLHVALVAAIPLVALLAWRLLDANPRRWLATAVMVAAAALTTAGDNPPWRLPAQWSAGDWGAEVWPAPDPEVASRLPAGAPVWDIEDALANVRYRRPNPSRHHLAYCIPSPAGQRRALADLQAAPPAVVFWRFPSGTDGIANPLRYRVLVPWLCAHYRPDGTGQRLWPGNQPANEPVPETAVGPIALGRAALTWGRRPLPDRGVVAIATVQCRTAGVATLSFDTAAGQTGVFTFEVAAGTHRYLVPVGCHPLWWWGEPVGDLRIEGATVTTAVIRTEGVAGP